MSGSIEKIPNIIQEPKGRTWMKTYKVYFEIFGKKMFTNVEAANKIEAQNKIKAQIIFHKTQEIYKTDSNISVDDLKRFFGIN